MLEEDLSGSFMTCVELLVVPCNHRFNTAFIVITDVTTSSLVEFLAVVSASITWHHAVT